MRSNRHSRSLSRVLVGASAVTLAGLAFATPALADEPSSTIVTPAGDSFVATLADGVTADFRVQSTTVSCTESGTSGAVPAAPGNANPAGPVTSPIAPATFKSEGGAACRTNVPFTTATTTSNANTGTWTVSIQYDPAGSTATLTIPQGGVITQIKGLASCTVTVAPKAPAAVTGVWVPGTETSLPVLDFSAGVEVPIEVTGGAFCPTAATTAVFSAQYTLANATDPARQIAVGPAPAPEPEPTPTPTPTQEPTPDPEPTSDPEPTQEPTSDPEPTQEPEPTEEPAPAPEV